MKRKAYAADEEYCLIPLSVEDKENYINLRRQIADTPQYYSTPQKAELMWQIMTENEDINYSIYDVNDEYCGNVILQNPQSDTPEIGIDLLEEKRNQGIGPRVIILLARQVYLELNVEYFLLRVSSLNSHSLHMIKKLGAILVGEEESKFKGIMQSMRENLGEDAFVKTLEQIPSLKEMSQEEEVIFRYQLTPNMFKG